MQGENVITFQTTWKEKFQRLYCWLGKKSLSSGLVNQQVYQANYVRLEAWHQNLDLS